MRFRINQLARQFSRHRLFFFLILIVASGNTAFAGGKDDPLLYKVAIDQFEVRDATENNPVVLDGQAWAGNDLDKLSFKFEAEKIEGSTEDLELQALYSRAILPYWDLQFGLRKDFQPTPSKNWLAFGVQGLAPYFFEVDAALFLGEHGHSALRLEAEYELLLTQKLILSPELEVNFYGKNDAAIGVGSGLSDVEAGLRLRYEIRREFAPYIGVNLSKRFGRSADFARSRGEEVSDLDWVIGLSLWF